MKIGSNYCLSFCGSKKSRKNATIKQKNEPVTFPVQKKPVVEVLKAYNLIDDKKGVVGANITPDYDGSQLVFNVKSPYRGADKVKFVYTVGAEKIPRETFSSSKDIETGEMKVEIPVLNRIYNSVYPSLTIHSAQYFNETNKKIGEETPEKMVINPEKIMTLKDSNIAVIDGETVSAEFDSISEGNSIGKLVKMEYGDVVRYRGSVPIIAILSENAMNEMFGQLAEGTFTLPMNVKGLIMSPPKYKQGSMMTDALGHAVSRLRGRKIFALMDKKMLSSIEDKYLNNPEKPYVKIKLNSDKMEVSGINKLPKTDSKPAKVPEYEFVEELLSPEDERFTPATVGLKGYNLGRLKKLQQEGGYSVPLFYVVPSGVWNAIKKSEENAEMYGDKTSDAATIGDYHFHAQKADRLDNPAEELRTLRNLIISGIIIPKEIRTSLIDKTQKVFDMNEIGKGKGCLIARSSFNGEDSDTIATQGLYDSFPGIRSSEDLFRGIKEVGASKWSELAYMSRRNHKIPHSSVQPNIIIQQVVPVDYTFTINTADPRKNNKNKMVIQLSQGVYSCFPNSPYIFEYDKTTGEIERKNFATKKRAKDIEHVVMDDFMNTQYVSTDYSKDPLNMDKKHYIPIMKKVFEVAKFIEDNFGGRPQDIEGGIIFQQNPETGEMTPDIHIWQTRDVHLIKRDE